MSSIARQPDSVAHSGSTPLAAAERRLAATRAMAKALLVVEGLAWTFALVAGLLTVEALTDAALRLPAELRWIILFVGAAITAAAIRRWVIPALTSHIGLTWLALRLERVAPQESEVRGILASGLELGRASDDDPVTKALHRRAINRAVEGFERASRIKLLRFTPSARALAALVGVASFAGTLAAMNPEGARTALARTLTPWSNAEWPKRTEIADGTDRDVHPADTALPVRANLFKTNREAGETRVELEYRVIVTDAAGRRTDGPTRVAVMTPQRRPADVDGRTAEVFERLVDPSVFGVDSSFVGDRTLSYRLSTEDDATDWQAVRLVNPPELVRARAVVEPPAYALTSPTLAKGELALGRASDERAIVGPVLEGSRVTITAVYSSEIELPEAELNALVQSLGIADADVQIEADAETLSIRLAPSESVRVPLNPVDRFGFAPREETVLAIDVVPDRDPSPAIVDPVRDEAVLATAVIPTRAEARDDIGLTTLSLERLAARRPADSPGAPPEPDIEPTELGRIDLGSDPSTPNDTASIDAVLDLSVLSLRPGDEVRILATAEDARSPGAGRVTSAPRTLRVIEETELVERLRARLDQVRRASVRLDGRQGELARALPEPGEGNPPESLVADQAALTDRLIEQRRAVEALAERQQRNALDDTALEGLLDDARELLNEAARSSAEAAQAANNEQNDRAEEAQRDVRRDLGRLLELLDRGEDGYVVRRALERLLDDQQRLRSATENAGEQTAGVRAEDLTPEQRGELERIAELQRELAERAERTIDELAQRSEQLDQSDPGQSQALEDAASAGRQAQVSQQLEAAAQQAEQNQTSEAAQNQQEAIEAIEEMLERLDQADRLRDRALQRVLATIVDRIKRLIDDQRRELAALAAQRAADRPDTGPLAVGMIEVHGLTLALVADAVGGPPETRLVADPLQEAAEAQIEAIDALRETPPLLEQASTAERVSLQRLTDALDLAERELEEAEERERERLLEAVRDAYREALAEQNELREETDAFVGRRLQRRERATVRALGRRQTELAERIARIPEDNPQLTEAPVVALIHSRLDRVAKAAGEALGRADADEGVQRSQRESSELLASLLEQLGPQSANAQDDAFGDGGGSGGGGGGGGGGGDEPIVEIAAELRLLRDLQALTALLTREADDGQPGSAPADEIAELQRRISDEATGLLERLREDATPQPTPDEGAPDPDAPDERDEPGTAPDGPDGANEDPGADE